MLYVFLPYIDTLDSKSIIINSISHLYLIQPLILFVVSIFFFPLMTGHSKPLETQLFSLIKMKRTPVLGYPPLSSFFIQFRASGHREPDD